MWQTALAKATASMEGPSLQGTWAAMAPAAQRGHRPGSTDVFPLEVEQRRRGDSTRALVPVTPTKYLSDTYRRINPWGTNLVVLPQPVHS